VGNKGDFMPFKSKAQERYLYANEPQVAKKWSKEFPNQDFSKLPSRVKAVKEDSGDKHKSHAKHLWG